jgi:indole-3-glycerol phosphate synthase
MRTVPSTSLLISESGIGSAGDVSRLQKAGVSAYLVGSAFMAAGDPGEELRKVFFEAS